MKEICLASIMRLKIKASHKIVRERWRHDVLILYLNFKYKKNWYLTPVWCVSLIWFILSFCNKFPRLHKICMQINQIKKNKCILCLFSCFLNSSIFFLLFIRPNLFIYRNRIFAKTQVQECLSKLVCFDFLNGFKILLT